MATRTKTIRVPVRFGNVADVADGVKTSLGTVTINTPENSVGNPITFVSAMFFYPWQNTVSNVDLVAFTSFITLAGAGETSFVVPGSIVDSGEEMAGVIGPIDFTSYFNTNYGTGTSKDISLSVTIDNASGTSRGVYCYMELSYQFDDTASTLVQTICIPYEYNGILGATQATVATLNQLTGTGGLLEGYANLSIKSRWIQLKGNVNGNNTTTNITLSYSFNSGGTSTLPTKLMAGSSDNFLEYHIDTSGLDTATTNTFELWSSTANRFANIIISEWVTFEFTTAGTTQVVNYFEFPIEFAWPLYTSSDSFSRFSRNILIPEPNAIMENCALEIIYNTNAASSIGVRVGSQAFTTYSQPSNGVITGCMGLQQRFDSGSGAGAGLTLSSGYNLINIDAYAPTGLVTNITGTAKILYRSDVAPNGIPAHSRTVTELNSNMNFTTALSTITTNGFSFLNDATNYYINAAGYQAHYFSQVNGDMLWYVRIQTYPGESEDGGGQVQPIYFDYYFTDNEVVYTYSNIGMSTIVKQYPESPQSGIDLALTRSFDSTTTIANREGSKLMVSYSNVIYALSGSIAGSNGGTINLNLYRENVNNEFQLYQSQQVTGNGSYSFTVYDNAGNYQVVAYEDATYKGVSKIGVPDTDFDINLSSGGSIPEYGYAFA